MTDHCFKYTTLGVGRGSLRLQIGWGGGILEFSKDVFIFLLKIFQNLRRVDGVGVCVHFRENLAAVSAHTRWRPLRGRGRGDKLTAEANLRHVFA
jgi:hypothetical protein